MRTTLLTRPTPWLVCLMVLSTSSVTHADTLYGLYADANLWFGDAGLDNGNGMRELDSDGYLMMSASLEHGVPLVPNVRGKYTELSASSHLTGADIEINATTTDAIAYYEILDNVVSVDIGAGAKMLMSDNRYFGSHNGGTIRTYSEEDIMPMVYASVGGSLPFTGVSAKAEGSLAQKSGIEVTDLQADIKYKFIDNMALDVGAQVGYRIVNIDSVENKEDINLEFKGPYIGVEVHF